MKIVTNERLISRNRRIGQFAIYGSLIILVGGFFASWQPSQEMLTLAFGAMVLGLILSQVGSYYSNRFVRSPRPDEAIVESLKSLDDKYTLYIYVSPAPFLLVSPQGIWVLTTTLVDGKISYEKNRWRQKGGNWLFKLFSEGLGRPDIEIAAQIEDVRKKIVKELPDTALPAIQAALIILNPKTEILNVDEAPYPTVSLKKIKESLKKNKGSIVPTAILNAINALFLPNS